jgi:NADPH2:quinone reductase
MSRRSVVGMRAVEVAQFGGPEVLIIGEAPDPVPRPGEVVIDVAVADVLWVETLIRRGMGGQFFPVRPPYRPGAADAHAAIEDRVAIGKTLLIL